MFSKQTENPNIGILILGNRKPISNLFHVEIPYVAHSKILKFTEQIKL